MDEIIKEVAQKLVDCYNGKTTLRFPQYRKDDEKLIPEQESNDNKRISEQESKFFFSVVFDKQKPPFSFAVEVPTKEPHCFTGEIAHQRSALHDMVIYEEKENQKFKWVIELKSKQSNTIKKDFIKMAKAECNCVWFHTLESEASETIPALLNKFKKSWDEIKREFLGEYEWNFAIVVLKSGYLYRKKIKTNDKTSFPNNEAEWMDIKLE